jgi:uncharacterized repeat protein (TIGR03806 family)
VLPAVLLSFAALWSIFACASAAQEPQPYTLVPAFLSLNLVEPIHLEAANDGSGRLFIAEKSGIIRVFDPSRADTGRVFLDLRAKARSFRPETGLLGLAFHPDFAANGRFFVHYSGHSFRSVVSEFRVSPEDLDRAAAKERFVLVVDQPSDSHNGGQLAFGPDAYLYVGLGDGGGDGRPDRGQDRTTLLGSILRIDVDVEEGYVVPPDNPFVGNDRGWREEIWAYGLRNPWRFSFEPFGFELSGSKPGSGRIWVGDVGEDEREEINLVEAGGNYGWARMEGHRCRDETGCGDAGLIPPVFDYGRDQGVAVIGGHVYQGRRHPTLEGAYLYGDFGSRQIWALRHDDGEWENQHLATAPEHILAFGRDNSGETYVLTRHAVWSLEPAAALAVPPARLSEAGIFADMAVQIPVAGVLPYRVNVPLWSDGAAKQRYLKLPAGGQLRFAPKKSWELPPATQLIKSFYLDGRIVETRLLIKRGTGTGWDGFSYQWDAEGKEAFLLEDGHTAVYEVPDGDGVRKHRHVFPSRLQCGDCHTPAAGYILGWRTGQLNRDGQIEAWVRAGLFAGEVPAADEWERLPRPEDRDAGVAAKARAYLETNCAACHHPDNSIRAAFDLRFATPLAETGLLDSARLGGRDAANLVVPGSPGRSDLYLRMLDLGKDRMPPLATVRVDTQGAALVRRWIEGLALPTAVFTSESDLSLGLLHLSPPFPNPANATFSIPFRLTQAGAVFLEVFDLAGQRLEKGLAAHLPAGEHMWRWDADGRASGIYLLRLNVAGHTAQVRRVVLLR